MGVAFLLLSYGEVVVVALRGERGVGVHEDGFDEDLLREGVLGTVVLGADVAAAEVGALVGAGGGGFGVIAVGKIGFVGDGDGCGVLEAAGAVVLLGADSEFGEFVLASCLDGVAGGEKGDEGA